jgi:hypothetical protein
MAEYKKLKDICESGLGKDHLLSVENKYPNSFPMEFVLLSRQSLWYLCGFGGNSRERYIDDEAINCLLCTMIQDTSICISFKDYICLWYLHIWKDISNGSTWSCKVWDMGEHVMTITPYASILKVDAANLKQKRRLIFPVHRQHHWFCIVC